ncbi:MAG: hypothetical protein AAB728_04890, partial [Patescibacteria group bacterium]
PTAGMRLFAGLTDNQRYVRHEITSPGDVGIREVLYFTEEGLCRVDTAYWKYVDGPNGRAIITYPGCPRLIVIGIGGTGAGTLNMNLASGETCVDVTPADEMTLDTRVFFTQQGPVEEGWIEREDGYPSTNYHGFAGGTVNMVFNIWNRGLGGGDITVRVHVGQAGDLSDPVVSEFDGEIEALGERTLS